MSVQDMSFNERKCAAKDFLRTSSHLVIEPDIWEKSCCTGEEEDVFFDVNVEWINSTRNLGWKQPNKNNARYRYNFQTGLIIQREEMQAKHENRLFGKESNEF